MSLLAQSVYVDSGSDLASDPEYTEPAWYVVDSNGITAGPFDDVDQSEWWLSKAKRV